MTDTPEQTRKCSSCMWWKPVAEVDLGERGQCRGAPPFSAINSHFTGWPQSYADDWCGSFRMKEPGQ